MRMQKPREVKVRGTEKMELDTPIGMATKKTKKKENNKCWQGCGKIRSLVHRPFLKKLNKMTIKQVEASDSTFGYIPKRS